MNRYTTEYCSDLTKILDKIKKDGIAVVPNVISKKKLAEYQEEMWKMFEKITQNMDKPIKENDKKSWKTLFELYPLHSMLIQHFGIGHSKLAWDLRQEKKVIEVFAKLWNVKPSELLVSFDGMSLHVPPETTKRGWYLGNDWYHTDQSSKKKGLCCIQGMVTLYDVNKGDATFCYK